MDLCSNSKLRDKNQSTYFVLMTLQLVYLFTQLHLTNRYHFKMFQKNYK